MRERTLWSLLIIQLISQLSVWIGLIGVLEFLQLNVTSRFVQALFLASGGIVGVIFAPVAGILVDKYAKKKMLLCACALQLIAVSSMFIALYSNSIFWLLGYSIGIGCSTAINVPAIQSIIPTIVSNEHLSQANALNYNVITMARIFGALLAGLLLTVLTLNHFFIYAFLAYIIVFILILFVKVTEQSNEQNDTTSTGRKMKKKFWQVWPLIRQSELLRMIILLTFIPIVFIAGFNLIIIYISELHANPSVKGILYAIEGVAVLAGGLLIKRTSRNRNQALLLLSSCFLMGVAQFGLVFSHVFTFSIISFVLFGFALGTFMPLASTLCQQIVPKSLHGRFFSFKDMVERSTLLFMMIIIGISLDYIGLPLLVFILGTMSCSLVLFFTIGQLKNSKRYSRQKSHVV